MERNTALGMRTFDQSFIDLFKRGLISEETAVSQSDKPADMEMKLRQIKFDMANQKESESKGKNRGML
jgi:Tfp pilus assembly ATPase PilU